MYKWKHVALLVAVLATVFLGLHQFAVAMQAGVAQDDGLAGWQVEALAPRLRGLDFAAPTDGWAVSSVTERMGYKSLLYHYDGSKWRLSQTIDGIYGRSIDMVAATDGWLVGYDDAIGTLDGGKLYRYNGATWQQVLGPPGVFHTIRMLSAADGYLLTSSGLYHYDGATWQRRGDGFYAYPLSSYPTIFDVVDATNQWYLSRDYFGTVIHKFDGATWQTVVDNTDIRAFDMASATDGWVVGAAGKIWRFNGSTLTPVPSPALYELHAVAALSSGEAWAVGWGDGLLHFDGTQWQRVAGPEARQYLVMLSATEGWLDKDWHFSGGTWTDVNSESIPASLGYHDEVFDLGERGAWTNAYHFDGEKWQTAPYTVPVAMQPVRTGTDEVVDTYLGLKSIQMAGPDSGWAVGYVEYSYRNPDNWDVTADLLFRYTGGGWEAVAEAQKELYRISIPAPNEIWAIGDTGILRFDGQGWQTQWQQPNPLDPNPIHLNAIAMVSPQDGWAAGNAFAHYDGQQWQVSAPISGMVRAIDMVSATDGWAMGDAGAIWHYTGGSWQQVASPTDARLLDIEMIGAGEGWAVGYRSSPSYPGTFPPTGVILHYDGTAWELAAETPSYVLTAVSMADAAHGLIAGDYGLLLKLDLSSSGKISGAVRDAQGQLLPGIDVHAYHGGGTWLEAGSDATNAQGIYTLTVPAGEYRLYFTSPGGAYRSEYYNDQVDFSAATILNVNTNEVVSGINAALAAPPPPAIAVTGPVGTAVDQGSGLVTVTAPRAGSGSVTFARAISCSGGAEPSSVLLDIGGKTFAMNGSAGVYSAVVAIPGDLPPGSGPFALSMHYACGADQQAPVVGQLVLYDPSGVILDGEGKPIAGAVVSLHRIRDAMPDLANQQRDCRTLETRPGGAPGNWSGVPAPDAKAGVLANPALAEDAASMAPDVNPQVTGTDGRFGWEVATGCWYVTVEAAGYNPAISPLVGVPPAVTDLNLELTLQLEHLYLPTLRK